MQNLVLRIIDEELEKLHDTAQATNETHELLMIAHTIGVIQRIKNRIAEGDE